MSKSGAKRERAWERKERQNAPIVAHTSKIKMSLMAAPCLMATGVGAFAVITGSNPLGGGPIMHAAAGGIGALTAFVLLQMGFDSRPTLIIDENGITCRQPDIGTVPWEAIVGLGVSKAAVLRKVLMIAVDDSALDDQARKHVRNRVGLLSFLSPQVARFEGQMAGRPTIHIPIAYFTVSMRELERQIAEKVTFHGR